MSIKIISLFKPHNFHLYSCLISEDMSTWNILEDTRKKYQPKKKPFLNMPKICRIKQQSSHFLKKSSQMGVYKS